MDRIDILTLIASAILSTFAYNAAQTKHVKSEKPAVILNEQHDENYEVIIFEEEDVIVASLDK